VLVDMEGYPMAEVAQMLDCAVGTVKSRCSRGRSRLAGLLADQLGDQLGDSSRGSPDDGRSPARDRGLGNHPPDRAVPSGDSPRGPPPGRDPVTPCPIPTDPDEEVTTA